MKKKYFLIGIVFNILSVSSYADRSFQITGTIMDNATKEALPNASIILFEKLTNKLIQTQSTDQDGNFKFSNIEFSTYRLQIQYLGYQEYVIDSLIITKSIYLPTIYLISIQQNLSEISVTTVKPSIEQNANGMTVNVAENSLATGSTAYEFIKKIPGIEARENELNIRGKTISLLLNGRLINVTQEEMINILKSLPATSIDKIEVISNPTGKYDGQVQAILDIKTFKPKNDNWGLGITLGGGTGRKLRNNSSLNFFYKKKNFSSSIGWDYTNINDIAYYRRSFSYSQSTFSDHRTDIEAEIVNVLKLDIDYSLNKHHSIGFFVQPTIMPVDFYSEATTRVENKNTHQLDSIDYFKNKTNWYFNNLAGNIHYQTNFDSIQNKQLTINGDYYKYDRSQIGNYTLEVSPNESAEKIKKPLRQNDNPLEIYIRSTTIDYSHKTSLGKWQAGLKASWVNVNNHSTWKQDNGTSWVIDPLFTDQYLYTEKVYAAYMGLSSSFKKINIDLFLRGEQTYSKGTSAVLDQSTIRTYINLFPTFNIEYMLNKNNQLLFSYRKNIRRPSYQDLNPFLYIRTQNFYSQGNPFLLPQLDHNWEITYGYKQQVFIKIFYQQRERFIREIIQESPNVEGMVRKMQNYLGGTNFKITLTLTKSISRYWHLTTEIQAHYSRVFYPNIQYGPSYPNGSLALNSTFNLGNNWNLEFAGRYESAYSDGVFRTIANGSLNGAVKKSFLNKKIITSFLINGTLPYWPKQYAVYTDYMFSNNFDSRFFMLSISYKIGNNKNEIKNRKTAIDTEKSRTQ